MRRLYNSSHTTKEPCRTYSNVTVMETTKDTTINETKNIRIRSILAWYRIMIDDILNEKYDEALEDSTIITQMIQKIKEEQE